MTSPPPKSRRRIPRRGRLADERLEVNDDEFILSELGSLEKALGLLKGDLLGLEATGGYLALLEESKEGLEPLGPNALKRDPEL